MEVSSLRGRGGEGGGKELIFKIWYRVFVFISFQDLYCLFCLIASSSDSPDRYVCCALKKIKRENIKLCTHNDGCQGQKISSRPGL